MNNFDVKKIRTECGFSQAEMSKLFGCTSRTLIEIEKTNEIKNKSLTLKINEIFTKEKSLFDSLDKLNIKDDKKDKISKLLFNKSFKKIKTIYSNKQSLSKFNNFSEPDPEWIKEIIISTISLCNEKFVVVGTTKLCYLLFLHDINSIEDKLNTTYSFKNLFNGPYIENIEHEFLSQLFEEGEIINEDPTEDIVALRVNRMRCKKEVRKKIEQYIKMDTKTLRIEINKIVKGTKLNEYIDITSIK